MMAHQWPLRVVAFLYVPGESRSLRGAQSCRMTYDESGLEAGVRNVGILYGFRRSVSSSDGKRPDDQIYLTVSPSVT